MPYRLLIFACLLLLCSCNRERPVSKEEAALLAKKIVVTINRKDPIILDDLLDADAVIKKLKGKTTPDIISSYKERLPTGLREMKFGAQVVRAIDSTGFYHLVKQYEKDGKQHLLFCMYGSQGLNYHDFELVKVHNSVKASDVYIYIIGQTLSESFIETSNTMDASNLDAKAIRNADKELRHIRELMSSGKNVAAKKMFDQLPMECRKVRACRKIEVMLLYDNGDMVAYEEAAKSYVKDFSNGPDIYFTLLSTCLESGNYDGAMDAVNKLDRIVDKDPFLDYYRGVVYKLKKNSDSAQYFFSRTIKNYPEFGEVYLQLLSQYAIDNNKKEAVAVISAYRSHPKFSKSKLALLIEQFPSLAGS